MNFGMPFLALSSIRGSCAKNTIQNAIQKSIGLANVRDPTTTKFQSIRNGKAKRSAKDTQTRTVMARQAKYMTVTETRTVFVLHLLVTKYTKRLLPKHYT